MRDFFMEYQENFLQYLKVVKQASSHTLRNYEMDLGQFQKFGEEFTRKQPLTFKEINKRMMRAYLADLHRKQAKKRTILRRLSSLRSFFKYLIKEGLVSLTVKIDNSKNLFEIPEDEILNTRVIYTILSGRIIYSSIAE